MATAGLVVASFSTITLPPKQGWVTTKRPSWTSRPVMSTSRPAPRRAAQAAATSRPSGEPEQRTRAGSAAWIAAMAASMKRAGAEDASFGALDHVDAVGAVAAGGGHKRRGLGGDDDHAHRCRRPRRPGRAPG